MMQNHIRLDDLLARDVGARWFEGVAVVQLVCRQLLAQGSRSSGFPRSRDILLGPGGSITIAGESAGNPVQAAAHLLALMLSDDVPVRLRLAVSQATASASGYSSLAEFSEALAYFERPSPQSIVDALRQRALVAAPRQMVPSQQAVPSSAVEPPAVPLPAAARRRASWVPLTMVTIAAIACASVWLIGLSGTEPLSAPDVVAADSAKPAASDKGAGRKRSTKSVAAPVRQGDPAARAATENEESTRVTRAWAPDAAAALQVSGWTVSYSYPELSPFTVPVVEEEEQIVVGVLGTTGDHEPDVEQTQDRIYSKADREVTLPLNVYPRLPPEPPGFNATARTILELTITTDGLVERVKMLTTPRNVHEFMLLSAAKAWRFEPATIAGRPVRFRHTMVLTAMP
jgi:outer membrane biosynthesis protein TonB